MRLCIVLLLLLLLLVFSITSCSNKSDEEVFLSKEKDFSKVSINERGVNSYTKVRETDNRVKDSLVFKNGNIMSYHYVFLNQLTLSFFYNFDKIHFHEGFFALALIRDCYNRKDSGDYELFSFIPSAPLFYNLKMKVYRREFGQNEFELINEYEFKKYDNVLYLSEDLEDGDEYKVQYELINYQNNHIYTDSASFVLKVCPIK